MRIHHPPLASRVRAGCAGLLVLAALQAPAAVRAQEPVSQEIGAAGGSVACAGWQITAPAGVIPDGSTVECGSYDPNVAPTAPAGYQALRRTINVLVASPAGEYISQFNPPLTVCAALSEAELAGGAVTIVTGPAEGPWTVLPTTVTASTRWACASASHLSLFDLVRGGSGSSPTTASPAAPAAAGAGSYRVQAGDTLFRIALRFGTTVAALQAANGLTGTQILPGQLLAIPAAGGRYVVQAGDTLFRIALRSGTTVAALQAANGLRGTTIYPGQVLSLPGGTLTAAPVESAVVAAGGAYVVQAGDTLFSLARRFGTTVAALQTANGLTSAAIYAGQVLRVP
ncbi:MAG: LysM peptidoglycan-binding domain-containing protein [Anaerolineales bacterium]|nr:LysM peptidoglycan-binding domain-containing protein [Anaerolineales bacterium]